MCRTSSYLCKPRPLNGFDDFKDLLELNEVFSGDSIKREKWVDNADVWFWTKTILFLLSFQQSIQVKVESVFDYILWPKEILALSENLLLCIEIHWIGSPNAAIHRLRSRRLLWKDVRFSLRFLCHLPKSLFPWLDRSYPLQAAAFLRKNGVTILLNSWSWFGE